MTPQEFTEQYANFLRAAVEADPRRFAFSVDEVPAVAARMTAAIPRGNFVMERDSALFKLACQLLKTKRPTAVHLSLWFAANVQEPALTNSVPQKEGPEPVMFKDNHADFIGHTVYARTATNAYYGKLITVADDVAVINTAHDLYGETNLTVTLPLSALLASVSIEPRTPTMADMQLMRRVPQ